MGYVDDNLSVFIPPSLCHKTAGTWTPTYSSQLVSDVRTANASATTVLVPLVLEGSAAYRLGARIKSVDLLYKNATADLTAVTPVEIAKVAVAANTVAPTGAVVASTCDTANNTTAKRLTQAQHTVTVTPDADLWIEAGYAYYLAATFDCAGSSVLTLYGARVNYELRV
jgi:hypothetical protein